MPQEGLLLRLKTGLARTTSSLAEQFCARSVRQNAIPLDCGVLSSGAIGERLVRNQPSALAGTSHHSDD